MRRLKKLRKRKKIEMKMRWKKSWMYDNNNYFELLEICEKLFSNLRLPSIHSQLIFICHKFKIFHLEKKKYSIMCSVEIGLFTTFLKSYS